jgi:DnaJ family protein C protein 19
VLQVHRKLMKSNHPDLGGSPFIASKVNEAKELLVKELGGKGFGSSSASASS